MERRFGCVACITCKVGYGKRSRMPLWSSGGNVVRIEEVDMLVSR